jgi:hypothetical protein
MSNINLNDFQADVQGRLTFTTLTDYIQTCQNFLQFVKETQPTRIISPTHHNYIFYQYGPTFEHKITRPLNTDLFIEDPFVLQLTLERFLGFLADLQQDQEFTARKPEWQGFAIFLHDVQRAQRGNSPFGINSTFKTNHFPGYTVALNKLDGVYYVDPRPEMSVNEKLREQVRDFQQFLIQDMWTLSQ